MFADCGTKFWCALFMMYWPMISITILDMNSIDYSYHYNDVIMGAIASQITSLTIVYSIVYSGADQRKHQNSASLAFVRGNHRWPVNSPHKGPVTRKMVPFDDIIMWYLPTPLVHFDWTNYHGPYSFIMEPLGIKVTFSTNDNNGPRCFKVRLIAHSWTNPLMA